MPKNRHWRLSVIARRPVAIALTLLPFSLAHTFPTSTWKRDRNGRDPSRDVARPIERYKYENEENPQILA